MDLKNAISFLYKHIWIDINKRFSLGINIIQKVKVKKKSTLNKNLTAWELQVLNLKP